MTHLKIIKNFPIIKQQSDMVIIIFLYRYISLIFTSFFFLFSNNGHAIEKKLFIIMCLTVSSIILSNLYVKNQGLISNIIVLVLIETAGNVVLLIPSGGLESPYFWYSLNTILVTSTELGIVGCVANLTIYLFAATWISQIVLDKIEYGFVDLIFKESNFLLSLILITAAIQLLTIYIRKNEQERNKLKLLNIQLDNANKKIKTSMNYIMDLYQSIQLFSLQNDRESLFRLITSYAKKITRADTVLFYSLSEHKYQMIIEADDFPWQIESRLKLEFSQILNSRQELEKLYEVIIDGKDYVFVTVKSNYQTYGILGIEVPKENYGGNNLESLEQLKFLSRISSIVLQKMEYEKVNERLVITEEQNRIANEIHDSVLQRLFSVSCGLYTLIQKQKRLNKSKTNEDLSGIKESINNIMKDLRSAIYGLSWKKEGADNFIIDIESRIRETGRFTDADITFDTSGNSELLPSLYKKAIFRIIFEGVGNAVNHGKASQIKVSLDIQAACTMLKIVDNGSGFDINRMKSNRQEGLGIVNIHQLVHALNGDIQFSSEPGKGTGIEIVFPNNYQYPKEEVI